MYKILTLALILTISITQVKAQSPYITVEDAGHAGGIIYNGVITKYALINQPTFTWYGSSQNGYKPTAEVSKAMADAKGKVKFMIFGGTWCEDTQFILPKFFSLQEQAGISDDDISMVGVDRQKQSIGNLAQTHGITNVPTIIVMKDGKEVGRVVEYGKTGKWDKELADLL